MYKVSFAQFCHEHDLNVEDTSRRLNLAETVNMIRLESGPQREKWRVAGNCPDAIVLNRDCDHWVPSRKDNELLSIIM